MSQPKHIVWSCGCALFLALAAMPRASADEAFAGNVTVRGKLWARGLLIGEPLSSGFASTLDVKEAIRDLQDKQEATERQLAERKRANSELQRKLESQERQLAELKRELDRLRGALERKR
ncbi:MAG: hypothetical protein WC789_10010 [Lentisphaeria bacterium]|jgi:septal ring factor EnvC (AmiA/AmiB activator)